MSQKFNPSQILRIIHQHELGYTLESTATEFAIIGYASTARELMTLNNNHVLDFREMRGISDQAKGMWILWDMIGEWPDEEISYAQKYLKEKDSDGLVRELELEFRGWEMAGFGEMEERVEDEVRLRACVERRSACEGNGPERSEDSRP